MIQLTPKQTVMFMLGDYQGIAIDLSVIFFLTNFLSHNHIFNEICSYLSNYLSILYFFAFQD